MTSIEWLWEQIDGIIPYQDIKTSQLFNGVLEEAHKMHKQEIIDAYSAGEDNIDNDGCTIGRNGKETYYKETFVSKGSDDHIVYTNDIKKLIKQAHFDGQYLHSNLSKLLTNEMLDDNAEYYSNEIIQSLKLKT